MPAEPKTYRLRITFTTAVLSYGIPAFFLVLTVLVLLTRPAGLTKSIWAILLWLVIVGTIGWQTLRLPTRITLNPDGEIIFTGLIGQRRVAAASVQSISPGGSREGLFVLRHSGGKIQFLNQFDDFHEFLQDLKRWNPSIQLKGC